MTLYNELDLEILDLEIEKQKESTTIEVGKFKQMVDALGAPTIEAMASAGNNHQIKMLQSLGLTSTLITGIVHISHSL